VIGLQELYHRLLKVSAWEGSPLEEMDGAPLTHDILSALNLLEAEHCNSGDLRDFEENSEQSQWTLSSAEVRLERSKGLRNRIQNHRHCERLYGIPGQQPFDQPKANLSRDDPEPGATSPPLTQRLFPHSKSFGQLQVQVVQPELLSLPQVPVSGDDDLQMCTLGLTQAFVATTVSEQSSNYDEAIQNWAFNALPNCLSAQQLPQGELFDWSTSYPIEPGLPIDSGDSPLATFTSLFDGVDDVFDKLIGPYESGSSVRPFVLGVSSIIVTSSVSGFQ